ncbi:MAG: class I SAM-dependent methyltransferase [Chloroflexi bacterium]|nr:class I SAM-dependent methyltransferase [Chloroflexota bacterium]
MTKLYAWACERLYDEFAGSYDAVSWLVSLGHWAAWRRLAFDYLSPEVVTEQQPAAPRVLEIGFGTGELLVEMARRGMDGTGLELSSAMHKITTKKLARHRLSVARVCAVAQAMPLADASFDAILATFPAPYILEPATLAECARLLRAPKADQFGSGGRLVIVGLWVALNQPLLGKLVPLFYSSPGEALTNQILQRLTQAGFSSRIIKHKIGLVSVGVIVGERLWRQE